MKEINRRTFIATSGAIVAGQLATRRLSVASPNDTVGIGFVGLGSRGTVLLNNLLSIPGFAVRAVCDIDADRLDHAQQLVVDAKQPKPAATDQWKKLLESKEVDAVVSALPCDLHAANYLDTLAAGKDLYAEKPMCLTVADCDAVINAAKRHQRIVQIGFQRRSDPRFIETMQQVHEGELGDLIEGRVLWSNAWGPLYRWLGLRQRSGDWMVEQAVHNWDVMNWANRCLPTRALGLGRDDLFREKQPERNVHDYYAGMMQYENGVFVNIIHSWVSPGKFNEEYTRLIGARGGIDFNSGTFSYRPDLKKEDRVAYEQKGEINSTHLALQNFLKAVRDRSQPVATVAHGREAVIACLLMRQAVYTKRPVELKEVLAGSATPAQSAAK